MVFRRNASHVYTGLSLTLVAQAACFPLFGSRSGTVPRPEPQGTAATPPPVAASQIAATVAVPIRWVQDTVNTRLPRENIGAHAWAHPVPEDQNIETRHAVRRRDVRITPVGNGVRVGADFVFKLKTHYRVFNFLAPGGSCAWDSDDAFDPPAVPGRIDLTTLFSPRGDWSVAPSTTLTGLTIGSCPMTIFNFDASGLLQLILSQNITNRLGEVDNAMAKRLRFKQQAESLWSKAQRPIAVGPGVVLTLSPERARVSPLTITADSLHAAAALTARPVLWVGSEPPPAVRNALPALGVGAIDSTFALRAVIVFADSAIGRAIADTVVGLSLKRRVGPFSFSTRVTDAEFYGVGDTAVVRLALGGKIRGNLWVTGVPTYDAATRQFALRDVALTASSEQLLSRVGFALGKDHLLRAIVSVSTVDLGARIDTLRAQLDTIADHDWRDVKLNVAVRELTPLGVFRLPQGFATLIDMRGVARARGVAPH